MSPPSRTTLMVAYTAAVITAGLAALAVGRLLDRHLAGDLFTSLGNGPAITTDDLVESANAGEDAFHQTSMGPDLVPTLHRLADLQPATLAVMHGSSFNGDGAAQLRSLAASYDERLAFSPA